jgi:hypothetical protein
VNLLYATCKAIQRRFFVSGLRQRNAEGRITGTQIRTESRRSMRLRGLVVRKFTCTNTSVLIRRRLTTRTATAWTTGARIFVELEEPTQ